MNILVVEDDAVIREGVVEFLTEEGYRVWEASDGKEGLSLFQKHPVHLMLLDIMLPKMDGIELLQEVRKSSKIPVLMLTAMTDEETQVKSFDALADDYMCKPFSLILLKKRVEALLRRNYAESKLFIYKDAVVDFNGFTATCQGKDAMVKPKEIRLLELLAAHKGQVLTREQILNSIWSGEDAPFDRVVDVYVKNLRKKLKLDCIITVKGVGYKLEL